MARYIFITGGVVSSLGKGLASAALGALLQARGYSVRLRKLDPYLNVDPGTMSPTQHGEVFVTDDGAETDLDLGHYERFTGRSANKQDNITTGRISQELIAKERRGVLAQHEQRPDGSRLNAGGDFREFAGGDPEQLRATGVRVAVGAHQNIVALVQMRDDIDQVRPEGGGQFFHQEQFLVRQLAGSDEADLAAGKFFQFSRRARY